MADLHEIEAIKRLKYRYCRCLDQKLREDLEQCPDGRPVASAAIVSAARVRQSPRVYSLG